MKLNDVLILSLYNFSKLQKKMGAGQSRVKEEEVEKLPQYTIMGGSAKFKGRWLLTCHNMHLHNHTSVAVRMHVLSNA